MTARFSRMIGMAAAMAIFTLAPAAQATDYLSNGNGYWDNSNTWWPPGVPGSGDSATIAGGDLVFVDSAEAVTTLVVSNGQLRINDGGVLTLIGAPPSLSLAAEEDLLVLDGGRVVITAQMTLSGSGSASAVIYSGGVLQLHGEDAMTVTVNHLSLTIAGALRVSENDITLTKSLQATIVYQAGSSIEIGPDSGSGTVTFTSIEVIEGSVTIKRNPVNASGVAIFDNQGIVSAEGGAITLDSTLSSISDTSGNCSGARWVVADSGASLVFAIGADGLTGGFNVGPGTLVINAAVETSGLFKFASGGAVDIVEDADSFNVTGTGGVGSGNHYCSGSSCSSTAFPFTSDVSCP